MLFNSLEYLLFLPVMVALHYFIPSNYRWVLLLIGSYFFYMSWKVEYIILIIFSTVVDYYAALGIHNCKKVINKKIYLSISLISNLGLLSLFKYANFFSSNINEIFSSCGLSVKLPYSEWLLPVGISFYTFQTLSYTIDVYNGKIQPEKHLGKFALFVIYFPQLVAGPIERASHLIPELKRKIIFNQADMIYGLRRILFGLFKKVVVADRLSLIVNHVYASPEQQNGLSLLIATYFFAIQIYCDFSGYSDIAIGSSRILGIRLMENFNTPYFSRSITEFWSRWHISLSTWFRDYLYIPLGGNRVKLSLVIINVMIVFLISGLWHGANWTFVVWGAIHGFILILERLLKWKSRKKINSIQWWKSLYKGFFCFHLVVLAWVFFRADSVSSAILIIKEILTLRGWEFDISMLSQVTGGIPTVTLPKLLISLFFTLLLFSAEFGINNLKLKQWFYNQKPYFRWLIYYFIIASIIFFGNHGQIDFIYFQF